MTSFIKKTVTQSSSPWSLAMLFSTLLVMTLGLCLHCNARPTANSTSNGAVQLRSKVSCTSIPHPQLPPLAAVPCEKLINDFYDEYEDFGSLEWGTWAPQSRRLPFMTENKGCSLTIQGGDPMAADKFAALDLEFAIHDIFTECLLQRRKSRPGTAIISGGVWFTGLGTWNLQLVVEMKNMGETQALETASIVEVP